MNRNFKRVLAGLAALTICAGIVPAEFPSMMSQVSIVAAAAVDLTDYTQIPGSSACYKIVDDTLYIEGLEENAEVPEGAFFSDEGGITLPETVTKLVIGENITSIGSFAFYRCGALESVEMLDVTTMGQDAFSFCGSLQTVEMPSVTSIGYRAFFDCTLQTVKFGSVCPDGLGYISTRTTMLIPADAYENYKQHEEYGYTFYDYDGNILTFVLPEGYEQIGDSNAIYKIVDDTLYVNGIEADTEIPKSAFDSYDGIKLPETVTKVVIEENISSISHYAFCYCKALTEVSMPNVTSIGSYAFRLCSFKSIDMPNVTSIGSCAFDNCKALTEVSMPNVTSIGSYAFRDAAITSVDLSSVTFIGEAAFSIFDGTTCPNPNLVSVKFGEAVPNGLKYARFSSSTKLLIPAEAYEAYQQYEEYGYTFYDYDGNKLTKSFADYVQGIGFTLDGKIGVKLQTAEKAENFKVTCGEKSIPVVANNDSSVSFYIPPKDMVKDYTITVNGTEKTITPVDLLEYYKDDYEEEVASALAEYCNAADAYFSGNEVAPVKVNEEVQEFVSEFVDEIADTESGNIYKSSLILDTDTALKVYIANPDGIKAENIQSDYNAKQENDKVVSITFNNIPAQNIHEAALTVNGDNRFSVLGYVNKVAESGDENLKNLCKALTNYAVYTALISGTLGG